MERIVRFSADITAADTERRTIVGTVVPYGVTGSTSLGPVIFQPGSITAGDNVKLLLEHDGRRPIGKATGFVDGPDRLVGSFRISQTSAGTDSLVEASDGLRDGLSVGASILESTVGEAGELIVSAAELVEVSLVTSPAFQAAQVTQVAASADPDPEPSAEPPAPSEEDVPHGSDRPRGRRRGGRPQPEGRGSRPEPALPDPAPPSTRQHDRRSLRQGAAPRAGRRQRRAVPRDGSPRRQHHDHRSRAHPDPLPPRRHLRHRLPPPRRRLDHPRGAAGRRRRVQDPAPSRRSRPSPSRQPRATRSPRPRSSSTSSPSRSRRSPVASASPASSSSAPTRRSSTVSSSRWPRSTRRRPTPTPGPS
jgi:HK97 family phage prohead protease